MVDGHLNRVEKQLASVCPVRGMLKRDHIVIYNRLSLRYAVVRVTLYWSRQLTLDN